MEMPTNSSLKGVSGMKHQMKLKLQPFNMIRSSQKTFELRLYDEKRQKLQIGDEIELVA